MTLHLAQRRKVSDAWYVCLYLNWQRRWCTVITVTLPGQREGDQNA